MTIESVFGVTVKRPGSVRLRRAFLAAWFVDLVATILFFLVPYAYEVNPVTVFFYGLFGLPGVVLAGVSYAGLVVVIGHFLSNPFDGRFVGVAVSLYTVFATNNIILLLFRTPLLEIAVT